jgi:ferredoxin
MAYYEDETVLIGEHHTSVSEDAFVVIWEEKCDSCRVVSSASSENYRIEVYCHDMLEDAVEYRLEPGVEIRRKEDLPENYQQLHRKYCERYCPKQSIAVEKEEIIPGKPSVIRASEKSADKKTSSLPHASSEKDKFGRMEGYIVLKRFISDIHIDRKWVISSVFILVIVLIVTLGRWLICNDQVIGFFLNDNEKTNYYEQIEPLCHKLEKSCMKLIDKNGPGKQKYSYETCRKWCNNAILSEKVCSTMLPYFPPREIIDKPVTEIPLKIEPKKKALSKEKNVVSEPNEKLETEKITAERYMFDPDGKIVLSAGTLSELHVTNYTEENLIVSLENMQLDGSEHEEIVQFRLGVSRVKIPLGQSKTFKIFLEPTYYAQFKKGKYQGKMFFSVENASGEKEQKEERFFFEVK